MNRVKILTAIMAVAGLSACSSIHKSSYTTYTDYNSGYQPYLYTTNYYQDYDGRVDYSDQAMPRREVKVPDSYHVGSAHSPTSHKDRDRGWVRSQNPQGYTIEIAESEKASQVAGRLYKIPKNDRTAQIKYHRGDKSYYKGLYGSYNSYEEAQKALSNLPQDIRQGAGIKNWGSIQNNVNN
ncbi:MULTISPECIES: SPOR domain-containing protein [unclassified Legionella]|uniref:SPOR domain-containing protein n=1 Tax=unclassified Legionella TaxID=2622702 RepID=UPI0010565C6D|nr:MULTISPECIES: SPOR domain-containing protein [unclassified Legionella]MDI9817573.1 SPOR domain-containing protein [Legionella sp. PL877]